MVDIKDVYSEEHRPKIVKLSKKQPWLVDLHSCYTITQDLTLQDLQFETKRHPQYSPDIALKEYHSFRNLKKKFLEGLQNAFIDFVESRFPELNYRKDIINYLSSTWQKYNR